MYFKEFLLNDTLALPKLTTSVLPLYMFAFSDSISALKLRTKQLMLLAQIHMKSGNTSMSLENLREARKNQHRVIKRVNVDQFGNSYEENKQLAKICFLMGQQLTCIRDNEHAIDLYKECLKHTPNDIEVLSSLARLYMQTNLTELCRDTCQKILEIDNKSQAASILMADLSLRKIDFDNAAYHLSQLLLSEPCNWGALAKLIEITRRMGTLQETLSFLQKAEQSLLNTNHCAGYSFCTGLFAWYSGNLNAALKSFNGARNDYEWGQQALFYMIEICINPDGELLNIGDLSEGSDNEFNESRTIALRTAERLLRDLRPNSNTLTNGPLHNRLLRNFFLLALKQRMQTDASLQDFNDMMTSEEYKDLVGPTLGMAMALVQLKQIQRAKNHLKKVTRVPWTFEEAEYLEKSWLLLADIYLNANKMDVAESYIERVLEHNKSCVKAYEIAGHISEKSQAYYDAVKHYHNAWRFSGRSKTNIGYKLAFNYMKIKRFADAVDICQHVIKLNPDYTIIRKDILEKCRQSLRP